MSYDGYRKALTHPILTREEERALLTKYAELRDAYGKEDPRTLRVRNQVITANLRAVAKMARKYKRLTFEDLMGEGVKGLIIAVERFEVERGLRFGTFAQNWVRHKLQRACEDTGRAIRLPVWKQQRLLRGDDKVDGVHAYSPPVSMDAAIGEDGSASMHDLLADGDATDARECVDEEQRNAHLMRAVFSKLTQKEREIVERRYLRDKEETLEEIGDGVFGVSRERVRQLQEQAFAKLRKALGHLR